VPTATLVPASVGLLYDPFGPDRNCGDFPRWRDAQAFYEAAGGPFSDPYRLDGDNGQRSVRELARSALKEVRRRFLP
jgi:hypothetical protein